MKLELVLVDIADRNLLSDLLKSYQKELLNLKNIEEYKYLDTYWTDVTRFPYFIKVDGDVAGFVLVNSYNIVENEAKNIAEFYIKKEFRNKGVGRLAANKTFELFPGKWEVRELKNNLQAISFWRNVIGQYTKNDFQEFIIDNEKWNGVVQVFNTLTR